MRCESEVRAQICASEQELHRLSDEIIRLTACVQSGDLGWREDLSRLAALMDRRRILQAQLCSLQWVVDAEVALLAG